MRRAVAASAPALAVPTAFAGTPCEAQVASPELLVRSMQMADLTRCSMRYQNSNGWVLEMLAYAIAPEDAAPTHATAQTWLASNGFQPTELALGTMTRLGARISKANIALTTIRRACAGRDGSRPCQWSRS